MLRKAERVQLEHIVGQPIVDAAAARWGFTNRTDVVTVADGKRLVVQRYRRAEDAKYRLRIMRALRAPGAQVKVVIPEIRQFDLTADPAWAIFEPLPGVPVLEAGDASLDGPRFPVTARRMGELLARFRRLPTAGLKLRDLWAHPTRVADHAASWIVNAPSLKKHERASLVALAERWPSLFAGRAAVLAHGDFAPMNVLVDGDAVTGLLDFESVRLADPLFDVAWWAWVVGFHDQAVLRRSFSHFLEGAEVDQGDATFPDRIHAIQVMRLLEMLSDPHAFGDDVRRLLLGRLRTTLR